MSLHDKISALRPASGNTAEFRGGFTCARHAAAELAVKQDALVAQLVEALEYALEDSAEIITKHVLELGENHKADRLKEMRDKLASARAALSAARGEAGK